MALTACDRPSHCGSVLDVLFSRSSHDHCLKQVPKNLSEENIFPTFDSFGPLKDVAIIRDKHTGLHRGCAFVTYWSASDAERAQEALHDKFVFPGGRRPAQVKPAEPSGKYHSLISLTGIESS